MSDRVNLPSGGWIDVRDPRAVTERLRRPMKHAWSEFHQGMSTNEALITYDNVVDLASMALIEAWSFPTPLTAEGLLDLVGDDVDAIRAVVEPLMEKLLPNFAASGVKDPKAGSTE